MRTPRKADSPKIKQYQGLWLKAAATPVELPCGDKATAVLLRFQLYNAVKKVRALPDLDPALSSAADLVSITMVEDPAKGWVVVMAKSRVAGILEAACEEHGITDPTPRPVTDHDLAQSFGRLALVEPDAPQRIDYAELRRQIDNKEGKSS